MRSTRAFNNRSMLEGLRTKNGERSRDSCCHSARRSAPPVTRPSHDNRSRPGEMHGERNQAVVSRCSTLPPHASAPAPIQLPWVERARRAVLTFGSAEVAGTATAFVGVSLATAMLGGSSDILRNASVVGVVGTLAENVGFYGVILAHEYGEARKALALKGETPDARFTDNVLRLTLKKYGWAEALDSLVVRPLLMSFGGATGAMAANVVAEQGVGVGIGAGAMAFKFIADAVYYTIVGISSRIARGEESKG